LVRKRPSPPSEKVMVTLFGRASGAIGSRSVSTRHTPITLTCESAAAAGAICEKKAVLRRMSAENVMPTSTVRK